MATQEELKKPAHSQYHDYISELPDGYDTLSANEAIV